MIRAYRIKEISTESTFELSNLLMDILDDMRKLDELNECHGTITINRDDLKKMKRTMKRFAKDHSRGEVKEIQQIMARVRQELGPEGYVIYYCY